MATSACARLRCSGVTNSAYPSPCATAIGSRLPAMASKNRDGDFTTSTEDVLTLVCDGSYWYEVARSGN